MPYIKQFDRERLSPLAKAIDEASIGTAGELNYVFTLLAHKFFAQSKNYQAINDVVGALEGAKAEFQRRVVAPYEDKKIAENGDVTPDQAGQEGRY